MATSDIREPAVYIAIDDRSYIGPPTESGRTVFGVILCDKGPDNRVVTVTSQKEYQSLFGTPNIQRCSQTHYMLNKALEFTGKVLVCRVSPANADIANVVIDNTSLTVAVTGSGDSYIFKGGQYNIYGEEYLKSLSTTGLEISTGSKTLTIDTGLVINVDDSLKIWYNNENYMIGSVDSYNDGTGELVVDVDVILGSGTYDAWTVSLSDLLETDFPYGMMYCDVADSAEAFLSPGQWIYSDADTASVARQVISVTEATTATAEVLLDAPYAGTIDTEDGIERFTPFSISNTENITTPDNIVDNGDFTFHFYANGSGEYYNNLFIKCTRNYDMERIYTDSDGVPYYPYIFIDFSIYQNNENGTQTFLEGPWTVSLIRRTPNNEVIRDFITGNPSYIEDVININSKLIRVKSGSQIDDLSKTGDAAEKLRMQLMLSLVSEDVVGMTNIGSDGISFAEGSDGTGLYDASGNISPSTVLYGRVANAYSGSLTSIDGTIENLPEYIYPYFNLDYVISGGYPINVQYSAAQLAAIREDCHHLADTGTNFNNYSYDIQARQQMAAWNYWTSSLYVQYRLMNDNYTGRKFWMSPVYHAIQTHLTTDNNYFLGEPPCNMEKGAIGDEIKLAYHTNHTTRGDLLDKELNYTIAEANGVYFPTQFTTWKRFSALKRQHIAKFVSYLKRQIPTILRDVIQRKATQYWLSQAQFRMNSFFLKFLDGASTDRYACINSFTANIEFDKQRSELNIYVTFAPILSIERINVFLTIPTDL